MTEEFLSGLINQYSAAITCFCFMGGDAEPLLVQRLASWIKDTYPHIKTAWYSGKEALPEGFSVEVLDYLKLGPYIEALGGLKSQTQIRFSIRCTKMEDWRNAVSSNL